MIIWLASYPRSGNTFLRVILNNVFGQKTYSLYDDKLDIAADRKTAEIVGHEMLPEGISLKDARAAEKLYIIKTHGPPPVADDKAIYLVRDGREASLSYKKYLDRFGKVERDILDIVHGNVSFGSWGEHIYRWAPGKRPNTLLLKFEDLIDNPYKYVNQLERFTGLEQSGGEIPVFRDLHNLNPAFFLSGKKDSWRNECTNEENESFWLMNGYSMLEMEYVDHLPEVLQDEYVMNMCSRISHEHIDRICQTRNRYREQLTSKDVKIESISRDLNNNRMKADRAIIQLKEAEGDIEKATRQLQKESQLRDVLEQNLQGSDYRRKEVEGELVKKNKVVDELEGELAKKNKVVDELEVELREASSKLEVYQELHNRINEMHCTAFIWHPLQKYRLYRALLSHNASVK